MITDPEILTYAEAHSTGETEVLKKLNRETFLKILFPRMLSGHLQGAFLKMISNMLCPEKILEIGTYTGYSAICLSEGLTKTGKLHTIEINPELEDMISKYFIKTGFSEKINLHIGNAINIIPLIDGPFDLVFIDADKENYLNYYQLVFEKVRKGGFIVADNVLWNGKVLKNPLPSDTETKSIIEFNEFVQNDTRVENFLLPFRDGLMIIRKL
ncbi:MAG: O-methyltransferase [Bacteroidetes bacterium]|nr:O-methyltransferase [Bacteroidota bacterium]